MKTLTLACKLIAGCSMLMLGAAALQAQTIYRIVGPDGKVTFSDKPPAEAANSSARNAAGKPVGAKAEANNLPFELRQVVARYPVTLYTGAGCSPCTAGRLLLQSRGVPYTEYTVSSGDDIQALERLSGAAALPFLTIGGQKIKGFSEAEWSQFLNAANYPAAPKLPAGYRNPEPKQLVVAEKATAPVEPAEAPEAAKQSPAAVPAAAAPPNPAGIKF